MSSDINKSKMKLCLQLGAINYIKKPVTVMTAANLKNYLNANFWQKEKKMNSNETFE